MLRACIRADKLLQDDGRQDEGAYQSVSQGRCFATLLGQMAPVGTKVAEAIHGHESLNEEKIICQEETSGVARQGLSSSTY
jgi:hypothetical protein